MNPYLLARRWGPRRLFTWRGVALSRQVGGRCLCVDAPQEDDCVWTEPDGTIWQVGIIRGRAYTLCWSE